MPVLLSSMIVPGVALVIFLFFALGGYEQAHFVNKCKRPAKAGKLLFFYQSRLFLGPILDALLLL